MPAVFLGNSNRLKPSAFSTWTTTSAHPEWISCPDSGRWLGFPVCFRGWLGNPLQTMGKDQWTSPINGSFFYRWVSEADKFDSRIGIYPIWPLESREHDDQAVDRMGLSLFWDKPL